jgi:polyisoprenyl-teichoic acid--peptidoglycan teichoic acid transferase
VPDCVTRSERINLRRALSYLGMTLILPGSVQLRVGRRRLGLAALGVWAGLWVLIGLAALVAVVSRGAVVALFTNDAALRIVQVLLILLALGWGALFLDAYRLARPPELARRHRLGFAILNLGLVLTVVCGLLASASLVSTQRDFVSTVFAGGGDTEAKRGRFNILLMGGDADTGRPGLRPDSMTVASIDAETGRTVLVSLPRNMEDVPFPEGSPMRKKFPKGFGCPNDACLLNAVYQYATEHRNLYPGVKDPGAQATKEAVEGATGLKINYYVLIDLKGFRKLVDAVGGIRLDINQRVPIGGGGSPVSGYIEPGRDVPLDGYHALWFARSRHNASDYVRMARQKCVMTAMLNQLDPVTVLTNFNAIASAGKQVVGTNVPASVINQLLDLAAKARQKPIASVALVPPLIYPGSPDIAKAHAVVQAKIATSEARDRPVDDSPAPSPTASSTPGAKPAKKAKKPKAASTKAGQDTEDLKAVCAAR